MNFSDLKNNLNTLNRESRIDELKKLKEELGEEDSDLICLYEEDYMYSAGLQKAIEIIDNHISELKREDE